MHLTERLKETSSLYIKAVGPILRKLKQIWRNYKVHVWQLPEAHSFSEDQMYCVFVSSCRKALFAVASLMLGN